MPLNLSETATNFNTALEGYNSTGSLQGAVASLGASDPVGSLVTTGTNIISQLLPEDKRAKFQAGMTFGLVGLVFNWIKGKPYTEGQYVLGERYVDHILNKWVNRDYVKDRPGIVANAMTFFTGAFGVRIRTAEDLDALNGSPAYAAGQALDRGLEKIDLGRTIVFPFTYKGVTYTSSKGKADKAIPELSGVDVYYLRPDHKDIPLAAVQRAEFLVKNFYPLRTYNKTIWDTRYFTKYPLVAPVPDVLNNNQLMTGELPGGAKMINGLIANPSTSTFLSQVNAADKPYDPNAVNTDTIAADKKKKLIFIILAVVTAIALLVYIIRKRNK